MPKTIDQRVVEMQFDNKNFEKNVATSMSTLDKLKEKLSFRGASKAIDELNGSMKGLDVSPLESALSGIGGKFSAFEQIAIGALRKIGEEALATGERLIKSLSIDNIEAGWSKYGQKTTSVSTLVAQGYALEEVNEQLERLNWFTDETSYNFTAMVGEIGKFTASGQGLEDSVTAMMGIANWAALSGQNASTASRAMYQLSQAMSKGALRYDDWKSIQNASMDTKEFREMAAGAAVELGSLVKEGDDAYRLVYEAADGTRELSKEVVTLNDLFTSDYLTRKQWLDTDVMMSTFNAYGKASKTLKTLIDDEWEGVETASAAMDTLENKAKEVAKEIMAVDSSITEDDAMNQALMKVSLESVKNLDVVKDEVYQYIESVKESTGTTLDFDTALTELGYGIDAMSLKALKAAQQARTWEDVIDSVKDAVSTGWMNTFEKLFGNQEEAVQLWTRLANDFWDIFAAGGDDRNNLLDMWRNWFDPKVRELKEAAIGIPSSVRDALGAGLGATNGLNGRELLFSQDENNLGAIISLLQTLKDLLGIIKDAWNETFYGTTDADEIAWQKADMLMAITKALKAFADAISIDEERSDKLRRTFKGLFAILGIIKDFVGTAFTNIWAGLASLFGDTNVDILDMTANLGDSIVAFREWLKENNIFQTAFSKIGEAISGAITWIKNFIDYIKSIPWVSDALTNIGAGFENAAKYVGEFFSGIFSGEDAGVVFSRIIEEIKKTSGVVSFLIDKFDEFKESIGGIFAGIGGGKDFGTIVSEISENVKNGFGGIADVFTNVKNAIEDFWNGTSENLQNAKNGIDSFVEGVKKVVGEINGERIIQLISGTAIFLFLFRMISAIKTFLDFFGTVGEAFESIAKTVKNVGSAIANATKGISSAMKENLRAKALISIAGAILMLVGALTVLYFLADDPARLLLVTGIIAALVVGLVALSKSTKKANGLFKASFGIAAIAGSLMLLVLSVRMLAEVASTGGGWNAVGILALLTVLLGVIVAISVIAAEITSEMNNAGKLNERLKSMALMIISFAGAVLVLAFAAKMLAGVDQNGLTNAIIAIGVLTAALLALVVVTSIFKESNFKGLGLMLMGIATSLIIFAAAIVMFSLIPSDVYEHGAARIAQIGVIFAALIAVSKLAGESASKAGGMLLKMSVAFAIMVGVIKLITLVSDDELGRGFLVITGFSAICAALIAVSKFAGNAAAKAGLMLIELSAAMVILTGVIWALSYLPTDGLAKAALVVSGLMLVFGGLIFITKLAESEKDITKTLITLTVAVVALAASVFALGMLDPNNVLMAAASMSLVLMTFAAVVAATQYVKKGMSTLIILTVAVGVIGGIIYLLGQSGNDAGAAIQNAAGIAIVFATMAGILFVLSKIDIKGQYAQLFAMVGAMALLALISSIIAEVLVGMKEVDPSSAIGQAAALSLLIVAMGGIIAAMAALGSAIGQGGGKASGGAAAGIVLGVAALAAISGLVLPLIYEVLNKMSGIDASTAIGSVTALSNLLWNMTGVVAVLGLLGGVAGGLAVTGIGIAAGVGAGLGIMIGIIALGALAEALGTIKDVIVGMASIDGNSAIAYATAISSFLQEMVGTLLLFSVVGLLAAPATVGISLMVGVLAGMLLLSSYVGKLLQENDKLQSFIDDGIPVIEQLGEAIGTFFGNIVGGFIQGVGNNVLDLLPTFGTKMSEFSANIQPFLDAIAGVKTETIQNVSTLISAIILLTAAEFVNGIVSFMSFMTGGNSMTSFASSLKELGTGIAGFSEAVNGQVNEGEVDIAVAALGKLVDLNSSINIITTLGQAASLTYFATQMQTIGKGIANFSTAVNGNIYEDEVDSAVTALGKLVNLSSSINIMLMIGQAASLSYFSTQMKSIGEGIANFSTAVNGHMYPQQNEYAFTALGKLVAINDKINVLETIAGTVGLDAFASQMDYIGKGIADFSTAVGGKIFKDDVENAVTALGNLVSIGNNTDFLSAISKAEGLEYFAKNLQDVGWGIVDFSIAVTGRVNKEDTDNAINVVDRLATIENSFDIISKLLGIDSLDKFSENLPSIGTAIAGFSKEVNGKIYPQANEQAFTTLTKLQTLSKSLGGDGFAFITTITNLSTLDIFASNLPFIGKAIAGFATAISGSMSSSVVMSSVNSAVSVLQKLTEIQNGVSGGTTAFDFIDKISGIKDMKIFSENLPFVAKGIAGFAKNLIGTTGDDGVQTSIDILLKLGELNETIDKVVDADKMTALTGTITSYKDAISDLGDVLVAIAAQTEKYKDDDIKNISDRIDELAALTEKAKTVDTTQITNALSFGEGIGYDYSSLQSALTGGTGLGGIDLSAVGGDWMNSIGGGFDVSKLPIGDLEKALTGETGLGGIDLSAVGGDWMNSIGGGFDVSKLPIGDLKNALTGETGLGGIDLSGIGGDWIGQLTGSMTSTESEKSMTEAGEKTGIAFINGYKTKYEDIAQAGTFSVEGLINAITAMAPKAKEAGEEIAKSLTSGIELTLKIASPSKVMYGLGEFAGEGFVNALTEYAAITNQVGGEVGESATDGIRDALAKSAYMFDTNIDIEPTIRPVLDLSGISEGVSQVDGMLNSSRSIALAGDISASMNDTGVNIQNKLDVNNDDVVNAISGLRNDVNALNESISGIQLVLDTKKVVGELVSPINTALGTKARNARRG